MMKKAVISLVCIQFYLFCTGQAVFEKRSLPWKSENDNVFLQWDEEDIGTTYWDLQTNASIPDRIHVFPDGTIGVTFFYGMDYASFPDRGTGYNYFDSLSWGPFPTLSLEPSKAGFNSYSQWGENGEMNVCHLTGIDSGLFFNRRENKGNGDWTGWHFMGPSGFEDVVWPRIATSGSDNTILHLLCITKPVVNGGTMYHGQDGALLYSRSSDGGATWNPENLVLPEIDSSFYTLFSPEKYLIKARGNYLAIMVGGNWMDLVLLKSSDSGESWTKTIVWQHPFPDSSAFPTDTFYLPDGNYCLELDSENKAHIAFGLNLLMGQMPWWIPVVDGIVYWNEDRPVFTDNANALNPYGHPDSELEIDFSLVGWTQDVNNNGVWDVLGESGNYYSGVSSMPQLVFDDSNDPILIFSSITETYHDEYQDYRHLWLRQGYNHGNNWLGFVHLYDGLSSLFEEHVFPSVSTYHNGHIYVVYQSDTVPGMAVRGDLDPFELNTIRVMDIYSLVGIGERVSNPSGSLLFQINPNPCGDKTCIDVELSVQSDLTLVITTFTGEIIKKKSETGVRAGKHTITLNTQDFRPGIYFCSVSAVNQRVTKKMIIR